ncbi:host attachment protein [Pseudotabrizicola alkalilacus]|uniref:Host attachment protein n=1 Tax=Pseudotabrizicola alkalilacus TaxID=2305252 RepID=A0A411Z3Y4_9RHOB|nr:host attachment protein [Pseudotabrizicola alkalilacus]RGP37774.1 hypothetical protein D1012_07660 [Pseudotabrizicola alkalilacus]
MTMITRGCWIVVVDGDGAVILENAGTVPAPDLRLIDRIETPKCDSTAEKDESARPAEASDRARLAETAMVAMLMTRLSFAVRQSRTSRLAIAAPPHLLEAIRTRLDDNLRGRVVMMLPKSLTGYPLEKIVSVMNDAMTRAA